MNKKYYVLTILLLFFGAMSAKTANDEKINVQEVLVNLENPDPIIRENAVKTIRRFHYQIELPHYEASKYRPQLIIAVKKRLNDNEKRVRYISAVALRRLAYDDEVNESLAIPIFIEAIKDKKIDQPQVLDDIIFQLGGMEYERGAEEIRARKEEIIIALKEHVSNGKYKYKHKYIRYSAAIALSKFDKKRNKDIVMPVFIEALTDKATDRFYKMSIAMKCRAMGHEAKEAVPGLIQARKEAKSLGWVSSDYTDALISIGTQEALEAVAGGRILLIISKILNYHPIMDFIIAFCFVWLFRKSSKLRKEGKKVFHWFLIIPILFYIVYGLSNMILSPKDYVDILNNRGIFIFFASIGLGPWLISWLFIWRRKKV